MFLEWQKNNKKISWVEWIKGYELKLGEFYIENCRNSV